MPTADRQKATVLVRIGFKALDPRILPDMGVKVTFLREEDGSGARRPRGRSRLSRRARSAATNGASYVFVVRQDTVERRAVQTGGTDGDRLEVTAGLRRATASSSRRRPDSPTASPIVIKQ